eukprot:2779018-Pleurochrysis_carterae.AAC.1
MSRSLHPSVSAAARRASRSSCLAPGNRVSLVDASTGRQSVGSAQSHTNDSPLGTITLLRNHNL